MRPGCDRWCVGRQEGHLGNEVMRVTTRAEGTDAGRNGSWRGKPAAGSSLFGVFSVRRDPDMWVGQWTLAGEASNRGQ